MNEYTPTTEQIEGAFMLGAIEAAGGEDNLDVEETKRMFDRWLAEVERAAALASIARIEALAAEVQAADTAEGRTHYESCWKHHPGCFAAAVIDELEGEERER
ncbi:hypothetical protein [Leucobacter luti]|uniref:hypothetical protein n=1 Tax=Leucobacter luti TaxID=340320 RepID=UPI003D0745D8